MKEGAAEAGVSDFLVAGNDIPTISLGWPRGDLDMVSFECPLGGFLDCGSYGFGLPPEVRLAPRYKLAREHAKSRFVVAWPYFDAAEGYDVYRQSPGVVGSLFYEMLANHTFPQAWPDNPNVAGNQAIYNSFFTFVKSVKNTFGDRVPLEDVGIYYSTSSLLMQLTPGGFINQNDLPHQFAVYGWGTALGELHYQYRFVPEWKLNADTLANTRVLVIPNAEVLDPDDVTTVIQPWVQGGGLLIVTGNSGERRDEAHNFNENGSLSLAALTGVSSMAPTPVESLSLVGSGKVLYLPDNIGSEYFTNRASRGSLVSNFSDAMDQILSGEEPVLLSAPGIARTVGLTAYADQAAKHLFIDINNMNCNPATDVVTATGPLSFGVALPSWIDVPDLIASAYSPDGAVTVGLAKSGSSVSINVGSVARYASVMLTFADTDGDGLSDGQEAELGTSPTDSDSDDDLISDYDEVWYDGSGSYNPYHPTSNPSGADLNATDSDTDGDGVNDSTEITLGASPVDADDTPAVPSSAKTGLLTLAVLILVAGVVYLTTKRRRSPLY